MKHRSCVKKKKKKGIICKPKDGRPRSTAPVGPERKKAKPASKRSGARTEAGPAEVEMEAVAPVAATIAAGEAAAGEVAAADDLCPEPPAAAEPQSKPAELKRAKRKEVAALAAQKAADLLTASKRQKIAASKLKRQETVSLTLTLALMLMLILTLTLTLRL